MAAFLPDRMIEVLERHRVRFVMVDGSQTMPPGHTFLTAYLDVIAERSDDNLARLAAAFGELQATLFTGDGPIGFAFRRSPEILERSWVWSIVSPYGRLMVSLLPDSPDGFPQLLAGSRPATVGSTSIPSAGLLDLIRFRGMMRDRWVLPGLAQVEAWHARIQPRDG